MTFNLAHLWAGEGKKVLAVDFDPQGNLTFAFTPPEALPEGAETRALFSRKAPKPFPVSENLWLLGADHRLAGWDMRGSSSDLLLPSQTLSQFPFDLILLDTPTGWRPLTRAALFAADYLVIPVDPSPFAIAGIVSLVENLVAFSGKEGGGVQGFQILGAVVNMAEEHTRVTQRVIAAVRQLLGEERFLGMLSKSVRVKETVLERRPLHLLAPKTKWDEQIRAIAKGIERGMRRR